jgi:hypothetical protein
MPRRKTERLYLTRRERVRDALIDAGTDRRTADRWCELWEAEAARQGILRDGDYFWDAAKGWIDAHRDSRIPLH